MPETDFSSADMNRARRDESRRARSVFDRWCQ